VIHVRCRGWFDVRWLSDDLGSQVGYYRGNPILAVLCERPVPQQLLGGGVKQPQEPLAALDVAEPLVEEQDLTAVEPVRLPPEVDCQRVIRAELDGSLIGQCRGVRLNRAGGAPEYLASDLNPALIDFWSQSPNEKLTCQPRR
jgi:hypothetical protein